MPVAVGRVGERRVRHLLSSESWAAADGFHAGGSLRTRQATHRKPDREEGAGPSFADGDDPSSLGHEPSHDRQPEPNPPRIRLRCSSSRKNRSKMRSRSPTGRPAAITHRELGPPPAVTIDADTDVAANRHALSIRFATMLIS